MNAKRIVSLLLLAAVSVTSVACGEGSKNPSTTTAPSAVTTAPSQSGEDALGLPDDLNYDGATIRILQYEGWIQGDEEDPTNMVYQRNLKVAEELNIEFEFTSKAHTETAQTIRNSAMTGSNDYEMSFGTAQNSVSLITDNVYQDITTMKYIDLDKPWWNTSYTDSVNINEDACYILYGDICHNRLGRVVAMFVNTSLLETYCGITIDELYEIILDGKWTIDKFAELCDDQWRDLNGNTERDDDDFYAAVPSFGAFSWMAYSAGIPFTKRDEDGFPVLDMNKPETVSLVEKLVDLFNNNTGVSTNKDFDQNKSLEKFANDEVIFIINRLWLSGWQQLRDMESDFAIIPYPKFDESVDTYHCVTESLVCWGGIPSTVEDTDMVSAVAEAMAYYGREMVRPWSLEEELKLKSTRDDMSAKMIDLMVGNTVTDYVYLQNPGKLGNIFNDLVRAGSTDFASTYAARETAAIAEIETMVQQYKDNVQQ